MYVNRNVNRPCHAKHTMQKDLRTQPLSGALGLEIFDVDLGNPQDCPTFSDLRRLLAQHCVLVFRRQKLSPANQGRFTRGLGPRLGNIDVQSLANSLGQELGDADRGIQVEIDNLMVKWKAFGPWLVAGVLRICDSKRQVLHVMKDADLRRLAPESPHPDITVIENNQTQVRLSKDVWHSDLSFLPISPFASVLYARKIPGMGQGDTMFCNMVQAYRLLSSGLKRMLQTQRAIHSMDAFRYRPFVTDSLQLPLSIVPEAVSHPIVREIPETGLYSLFVNPFYTDRIDGWTRSESAPILDVLYGSALSAENIYRHKWQLGDVLVWDNRCTMHCGVRDYSADAIRVFHRSIAADNGAHI